MKDVSRAKIRDQLLEVGFDDARQAEIVGGLSGGWKMKLELARAMLYNADLLLLDEVITICRKNQINDADRNRPSSLPITFVFCCLNAPELDQIAFSSWTVPLLNGSKTTSRPKKMLHVSLLVTTLGA